MSWHPHAQVAPAQVLQLQGGVFFAIEILLQRPDVMSAFNPITQAAAAHYTPPVATGGEGTDIYTGGNAGC